MIITDYLKEYIRIRRVEYYPYAVTEDGTPIRFTLSYDDMYAFMAITRQRIGYLNEELLKEASLHRNNTFFTVSYDIIGDTLELDEIIYGAPLAKCIKVVTAIKRILNQYGIGTEFFYIKDNIIGKAFTTIRLIKI